MVRFFLWIVRISPKDRKTGEFPMLNLLAKNPLSGAKLQDVFSKLKEIYCINDVSEDRKKYLTETIAVSNKCFIFAES